MQTALKHFQLGNIELLSGKVLPDAVLAYSTYGELSPDKDNVVLLPTFYTGSHIRNEGFFGSGRAIDPVRHFVISVNMFGNGFSSSPSNTAVPVNGPYFPEITLYDNVQCQQRLLTEEFGIERIRLVSGWSMARRPARRPTIMSFLKASKPHSLLIKIFGVDIMILLRKLV